MLKPGYTTWPRLTPKPGSPIFQTGIYGAHTFYQPMMLENKGIFMIAGPGVKEGARATMIRAVDVAPTLAQLLDLLCQLRIRGRCSGRS
ncbi:MAG: hypothetical protein J7L11_02060 [Thermoprotei archaeon]|nr:hypothetical protein [Thermoprotei archaeon]